MKTCMLSAALALMAGQAAAQDTDRLVQMVAGEIAPYCNAGTPLTMEQGTVTLSGNQARVRLGGFQCDWEFTNHAFCGARYCETRIYQWSAGGWRMIDSLLE